MSAVLSRNAVRAVVVVGIAVLVTLLSFLPVQNAALAVVAGVVGGAIASPFVTCPCDRCKAGRR